jgi:hypothetical protein
MVFASFFAYNLFCFFCLCSFSFLVPHTAIDPNEAKDAASTGVDTLDKRNKQKRAAKSDATPPKAKKI